VCTSLKGLCVYFSVGVVCVSLSLSLERAREIVYVLARETVCVLPCRNSIGWLRLVCSSNSRVFFAKEPYKRDDISLERDSMCTCV